MSSASTMITPTLELTSIHGVRTAGREKSITPVRLFWTTIYFIFFSLFIYQLVCLVMLYLSYPINVVITINENVQTFPAITLCNLNPYKRSLLGLLDPTNQLMQAYTNARAQDTALGRKRREKAQLDDTITTVQNAVSIEHADKHVMVDKGQRLVDLRIQTTRTSNYQTLRQPLPGKGYGFVNASRSEVSERQKRAAPPPPPCSAVASTYATCASQSIDPSFLSTFQNTSLCYQLLVNQCPSNTMAAVSTAQACGPNGWVAYFYQAADYLSAATLCMQHGTNCWTGLNDWADTAAWSGGVQTAQGQSCPYQAYPNAFLLAAPMSSKYDNYSYIVHTGCMGNASSCTPGADLYIDGTTGLFMADGNTTGNPAYATPLCVYEQIYCGPCRCQPLETMIWGTGPAANFSVTNDTSTCPNAHNHILNVTCLATASVPFPVFTSLLCLDAVWYGNDGVTMGPSANWSLCAQSCSNLAVPNGVLSCSIPPANGLYYSGTNCTLTCGWGYELLPATLVGPTVDYLCYNGAWSPTTLPTCFGTCGAYNYTTPPNLILTYSNSLNYSFNSTITTSCPLAFTLVGATLGLPHYFCYNATWFPINGANPSCIPPCPAYTPTDGFQMLTYTNPLYPLNSTVSINCTGGMFLVGAVPGAQHFSCAANQSWVPINGANPSCTSLPPYYCSSYTPPANGYVTGYTSAGTGGIVPASTLAYWTCNSGYVAAGDIYVTCAANRTWIAETSQPSCIDMLGTIQNFTNIMPPLNASVATAILGLNAAGSSAASQATSVEGALPFVIDSLNASQLLLLGYTLQDMVVNSRFGTATCNRSDFILANQTLQSGNCYTFNHKFLPQLYTETRPGEEQGLYAVLNIQQEEYLPMTMVAGMQVLIQSQYDQVFPDANTFVIAPGMETSLILSITSVLKLNTPNSICVNSLSDISIPYYYPEYNYCPEGCSNSLLQRATVQACGCASPYYPQPTDISARFCSMTDLPCVQNFTAAYSDSIATQAANLCPDSCITNIYEASRTFSIIPDKSIAILCPMGPNYQSCVTNFRSDMMILRVYFQQMFHTAYAEQLAMGPFDLLSYLGGTMGICCGMSLISCVETIIIVGELIRIFYVFVIKKRLLRR